MARLRTIKPGFFLNEDLASCQPLARLLFAGLWTIADREGRLEDRPRRIKAAVLPYDDCSPDDLLAELADRGFIVRYADGDRRYIAVASWGKHQYPNVKEVPSIMPGPPEHSDSTVQSLCDHHASTPVSLSSVSLSSVEESSSEQSSSVTKGNGNGAKADLLFAEFWTAYPRKRDKQRALRVWRTRIKAGDSPVAMIAAAKHYAEECKREERPEQFTKHATTFLGPDVPYREYVKTPKRDSGKTMVTCLDCGKTACVETDCPSRVDDEETGRVLGWRCFQCEYTPR